MKILKRNILYIYTDGSSFSNPRKGGSGIRFVQLDENEEETLLDIEPDGYMGATNNQMELYACVEGLRQVSLTYIDQPYNVIEIRSDSKYVIDNVSQAKYYWPKQNWLNSDGKPILNVDLWKQLLKEISKIKVQIVFVWVKGHAKDEHNKAVDKTAKKSANSFLKAPLSIVTTRRKTTKEKTKIGSVVNSGQKLSIKIVTSEFLKQQKLAKYRYEVISKGSKYFGKIDIAYSKVIMRDAHSYEVTFNKNINNPRILRIIREIK
ncbi:MAG: ribonuclease HI [Bacteroidetes bacterium]|nr:ribonuclease HI [Bacteroidota bacterium]